MLSTKIFVALTLLATADFAAHATNAQQAGYEPVSVTVPYGDLNLNNPDGARVMAGRVHRAIVEVCGDERGMRDLSLAASIHACSTKAREQVVTSLGNPLVTAMIDGKLGAPRVQVAAR